MLNHLVKFSMFVMCPSLVVRRDQSEPYCLISISFHSFTDESMDTLCLGYPDFRKLSDMFVNALLAVLILTFWGKLTIFDGK